jgi:hypothetical protein
MTSDDLLSKNQFRYQGNMNISQIWESMISVIAQFFLFCKNIRL